MIFPKYSIFLIELIIVLICASLNEAQEFTYIVGGEDAEADESTYIVGGEDARPGELPYQVSLQLNESHICGGSIYDNCWILTAAHCVVGQNKALLSILAGTTKLNEVPIPRATIDKIISHPNYKPKITNDIALIKLNECLPNNNTNIKPIKLLKTRTIASGTQGLVSGWGFIDQNGTIITNDLKKLLVTTIGTVKCNYAFRTILPKGTICAYNKVGEGFCQGDSGGPLVDVKSGEQMGIVSANVPCAKGKPDIYTKIFNFVSWIESNAK